MSQELLSVDQVAKRLGLNVRTVRGYVREGRLRATRIGKQYRIARGDLEAFTGHPVPPTDFETVRRNRYVEVTSLVQIDAISPEASQRLAATVSAAAQGAVRVETIYLDELGRMKVILVGAPLANAELLRLIAVLGEAGA